MSHTNPPLSCVTRVTHKLLAILCDTCHVSHTGLFAGKFICFRLLLRLEIEPADLSSCFSPCFFHSESPRGPRQTVTHTLFSCLHQHGHELLMAIFLTREDPLAHSKNFISLKADPFSATHARQVLCGHCKKLTLAQFSRNKPAIDLLPGSICLD